MRNVTEIALAPKGSSTSESTSSIHEASSSYFTETDSTIGNSVSLPSLASSFSEFETDVDSESCISEVISSEAVTSAEYSISDEPHDIQLRVKDSVNLTHQRTRPKDKRNDISDSVSNSIQKGFRNPLDTYPRSSLSSSSEFTWSSSLEPTSSEESSEIEITSRRNVSFLPASCSEVMEQPEKKGPVTRRHRIEEKKSAPLFSTPMQVTYTRRSQIDKDSEALAVTSMKTSVSGDISQETIILPSGSSKKSKAFNTAQSYDTTSLSSSRTATSTSSNEPDITTETDSQTRNHSAYEATISPSDISNELRSSLSSPMVSSVHGNSKFGTANRAKWSSFGHTNKNNSHTEDPAEDNKNNSHTEDPAEDNKNNSHTEDPAEDNGENENNSSNTMLLAQESQRSENIRLDGRQKQLSTDNKNQAIRRSITRLSPRSREALDKYLENNNQEQSSVISQSTTSGTEMPTISTVEPITERDVSQFYHLCTISDYEEEESEDETGITPPSSDEDCAKNITPPGVSFSSNFSDEIKEIKCPDLDRSAPECKQWVSTEKLLRDMTCRVKELEMLIDSENDHDIETDLFEELHHYDEKEMITPQEKELDMLINSGSDRDINTDPTDELHLDAKQGSSEDEATLRDLLASPTEGDSVRNTFSDSMDSIKENFLNLIHFQASQARDDGNVRKTLDKETNDKQTAKDNKVHPLNINQKVEENVEDGTPEKQTGPSWNVYDKFPSFWRISDSGSESDEFDHAYYYEG